MATYLLGASGECADCSIDDPCTSICGETSEVISSALNPSFLTCSLLENNDSSGYNYMIIANSEDSTLMAIQVCDDGFNTGPTHSVSVSTSGGSALCRTSSSSTTFALVEINGVTLFSLNESTLVITATSSKTSLPASALFLNGCDFITDGHLVMLSRGASGGGPSFRHYYYDVDVSTGTSVSFGSPVISTPDVSYGSGNIVSIGSGQCASIEPDGDGVTAYLYGRVISYSSGISIGSRSLLDSTTSSGTYNPLLGSESVTSAGGKASFLVRQPPSGNEYSLYVTDGSSSGSPLVFSSNVLSSVGMNTSSIGVGVEQVSGPDTIYTYSISGFTPSLGTTTSAVGSAYVDAPRESAAISLDWSSSSVTADLLT